MEPHENRERDGEAEMGASQPRPQSQPGHQGCGLPGTVASDLHEASTEPPVRLAYSGHVRYVETGSRANSRGGYAVGYRDASTRPAQRGDEPTHLGDIAFLAGLATLALPDCLADRTR